MATYGQLLTTDGIDRALMYAELTTTFLDPLHKSPNIVLSNQKLTATYVPAVLQLKEMTN